MYAKTKYVKTSVFDEIVLGGGTPSVLTAEQMIDLIDFCKATIQHQQRILHQSHRFIENFGAAKNRQTRRVRRLPDGHGRTNLRRQNQKNAVLA